MNERQRLLRKLSASQFAAWELHVYLDTHPCDKAAAELHDKYAAETAVLRKEFTEKYGALTPANSEACEWLSDPWPWDIERSEK